MEDFSIVHKKVKDLPDVRGVFPSFLGCFKDYLKVDEDGF